MDLHSIVNAEREFVAGETRVAQCPCIVAVNNLDDLARVPSRLRWFHPATITPLSGAKGGAFVLACPSLSTAALWVATENDYYRADYVTFLNQHYGMQMESIPAPWDVDHLYNRERARQYALLYVRTALVERGVNRSHGASYEKDVTTNEALRARPDMRLMDAVTSMKYFGFLAPLRSDPRESEIEAYLAFAASKLGLDPDEERKSIALLRQKASTPWAARRQG